MAVLSMELSGASLRDGGESASPTVPGYYTSSKGVGLAGKETRNNEE